MLGFFSLFKDKQNVVKVKEIRFVSIPDNLSEHEIRLRFSKQAVDFANALNVDKVFLNFNDLDGKEKFIEYDYEI